jgi:hypothetical protein
VRSERVERDSDERNAADGDKGAGASRNQGVEGAERGQALRRCGTVHSGDFPCAQNDARLGAAPLKIQS